jgi:primosomal protein N' (replication factor Y)
LHYYQLYLLKSSAPKLTYLSVEELEVGSVVSIPLKSNIKDAIVYKEVDKPSSFEVLEIISISPYIYSQKQIEIAKFISYYYFSSLGEAISLFTPYLIEPKIKEESKERIKYPTLTAIQQKAYNKIVTKDKSLLFGVTGSGKTEVFIALMAQMISEGKSSIFLMPEISLTPQMEKRLKVYFKDRVAMWHSKLTKKRKEKILEGIYRGEIDIVAGARSALFIPFDNLGLIVVDEEHDDSYKAMSRPRYHARDLALFIGQKLGAKVLLASATPSLSSYYKYDVVKLKRAFIETKKSYSFIGGSALTTSMVEKIRKNYNSSEQSLLFLPTRGNFKYLYCTNCGTTHTCPYCSVGMTLHRYSRHLKCHYCEYTEQIIDRCSICDYHPLSSQRMGTVEAKEMIEEQIPSIVVEQFDKDSISSIKKLKDALSRFETKESHILLGTQMLSKGHDYANITLSIIMGLDYIMGLADYRAKQKAISLLIQVAGRSGRAKEAMVIIQTNNRELFLPYLEDYELFLKDELEFALDIYPPFVTLARILVSHKDTLKASKLIDSVVKELEDFKDIEIVGYGKAPIEKIANKYRYTILLRATKKIPLLNALHSINQRGIEIDIDPVEFS